jgi:hypothetical protein
VNIQSAKIIKIFWITITISIANSFAHDHVPILNTLKNPVLETQLRVFKKLGNDSVWLELINRDETQTEPFKSFTLGYRYRLNQNWKVGIAYSHRYGVRHDDDWIWRAGEWVWRDTKNRQTPTAIFETIYRRYLLVLPGTNIFEARLRAEGQLDDGKQLARLRYGINKFIKPFKGKQTILFLKHELYSPLNYGKTLIYENWIYLGVSQQVSKRTFVMLNLAYAKTTWSDTIDFRLRENETYQDSIERKVIQVGLNLYF